MAKITKSSLAQLAQEMQALVGQEQKECVGGANSTYSQFGEDTMYLKQTLNESITSPVSVTVEDNGIGRYVGKEDGISVYELGEVTVTGHRPYRPFGNFGPTGIHSYDIMMQGGYQIGYEAGLSSGVLDDAGVMIMSGIAFMTAGERVGDATYEMIYYGDGLRRGLKDGQKQKDRKNREKNGE